MKDYLLPGLIMAILFALSHLAWADDPHSGATSNQTRIVNSKQVIVNNQMIGTAMALAAAQHHFDMRSNNLQTSVGVGYYNDHLAWSVGAGARLGKGKMMLNGNVAIEQGKTGIGAGLNWQW